MLFVAFNGIQNLQRQASFGNIDARDVVLLLTLNVDDTKLTSISVTNINRLNQIIPINYF